MGSTQTSACPPHRIRSSAIKNISPDELINKSIFYSLSKTIPNVGYIRWEVHSIDCSDELLTAFVPTVRDCATLAKLNNTGNSIINARR